jgi:hypothetical protein
MWLCWGYEEGVRLDVELEALRIKLYKEAVDDENNGSAAMRVILDVQLAAMRINMYMDTSLNDGKTGGDAQIAKLPSLRLGADAKLVYLPNVSKWASDPSLLCVLKYCTVGGQQCGSARLVE